ncbi:MAG TPA: PKD domain-containing protein [Polyangiaceae bacterium]|nr:PKD domain-containing protein [Polyangiaceae bacterium]
MKVGTFAAWVCLMLCSPQAARALTLSLAPLGPAPVGEPRTFKVASVAGAVGAPRFRWNFGDGTVTEVTTALEATHTYAAPGHYTVIVQGSDDESRTSTVSVQTAYNPPTSNAPHNSSSIVLDAARHRVWNVNPDANNVTALDSESLTPVLEAPVGKEPHSLAQASDGSIWVTSQMSDEVVLLDPDGGLELARVALPYASQPRTVAMGQSGMAYVSLFARGELVEIDTTTRSVKRTLALGPTPAGVSVASDGRIFVTRFLSPPDHGEVWVVDPGTFTLASTISLPLDLGPDTQSSGRGVPNYVSSIAISPDGTQAWVSAKKDDTVRGPQRDGMPMTADNFVRSAICTIDLENEAELVAKRQDIDNRSMPVAVTFSALGDYAFVLVLTSNWLGVMDAYSTQSVTGVKDVGSAPDGIALSGSGRLFVNAALSREVLVYDMSASLASVDHEAPDPVARIPTVAQEPLSAQLLLGKKIFYDSADTRMGHAGYWACASCHFEGYSDGRVWDFSDRGEGLRNTKSLLGIRGAEGQGRVHWSGNMDEIQDFERDIRESFQGTGFMSNADYAAHAGADHELDTLGPPVAGLSQELDALAAYITSLDHVGRSPFRNADGSFSAEALAGRQVYERAGCPACHSGPDFTDSSQGVLHDVGTLLPSSGHRLGGPLTGIDTPTLKGLWQSAPYLHDGRAATLRDVFAIAGDRMGSVSQLTSAEVDQMVRYLLELDDVPEAAPSSQPPAMSPLSEVTSPDTHACAIVSPAASRGDRSGASWLGLIAALWLRPSRRAKSRWH